MDERRAPIFIIGVPRSGTTLLRMMLDSHPEIMCGPEAPWIAGRGLEGGGNDPHLKGLVDSLVESKWGAVRAFSSIDESVVFDAAAKLLDGILLSAATRSGKSRWADKTPWNVLAVPFLARMFPEGRYIHLIRDGRDVALSTSNDDMRRISFRGRRTRNSYQNALKRWCEWNRRARRDIKAAEITALELRYEDLVMSPADEIARVLDFVQVEWDDQVLSPYDQAHDVVDSAGKGVRSFFDRTGIDSASLLRWKNELGRYRKWITRRIAEQDILEWGYEPTAG